MNQDEIVTFVRPWPDDRGPVAEVWTYNRGISRRVWRRPGTVAEAIAEVRADLAGQDYDYTSLPGGAASVTVQVMPV
jgi:hypothetical protein